LEDAASTLEDAASAVNWRACAQQSGQPAMPFTVAKDLPDMTGRVVVITGATSGLGLAARTFAVDGGAHVVMACRNLPKAQPLADAINSAANLTGKTGKASVVRLDTSDLDSVRSAVADIHALELASIDVLVLNAGIMFGKWRTARTASAEHPEVELMMATNHLGHFLLTNLLLPKIVSTPGARIISVSSFVVRWTKGIDYDVMLAKSPEEYSEKKSYSHSKTANLLFAHELAKRLSASGADTLVLAAHPGYARTNLLPTVGNTWRAKLGSMLLPLVSHDDVAGTMPIVMAAVDATPGLKSETYYCPAGFRELKGPPKACAHWYPHAKDDVASLKLWETSEHLTGFQCTL
jgi:NAD(P)-dependent dehydrogenase (short-subunit alcohol dehydrogenase family)